MSTSNLKKKYKLSYTATEIDEKLGVVGRLSENITQISKDIENFDRHMVDTNNPHKVTPSQIGAAEKTHMHIKNDISDFEHTHEINEINGLEEALASAGSGSGDTGSGDISGVQSSLNSHISNTNNPHKVTFEQIGAAPAGFGLGDKCINAKDYDWNNATSNGWFVGSKNTPDGAGWYGEVSRLSDAGGSIVQKANRQFVNIDYVADMLSAERRGVISSDGVTVTWGEWEWVTPPMRPNVEYRTIYRLHREPVYVKADDNGVVYWRKMSETIWHTYYSADNKPSLEELGAAATITGGATTITTSNLTANRALISNDNGKVAVSNATSTELGYLSGVTSAIQTQLDAKAASSHTHTATSLGLAPIFVASGTITYTGDNNAVVSGFTPALNTLYLIQIQMTGGTASSYFHSYLYSSSGSGSVFKLCERKTSSSGVDNDSMLVWFSSTNNSSVNAMTVVHGNDSESNQGNVTSFQSDGISKINGLHFDNQTVTGTKCTAGTIKYQIYKYIM